MAEGMDEEEDEGEEEDEEEEEGGGGGGKKGGKKHEAQKKVRVLLCCIAMLSYKCTAGKQLFLRIILYGTWATLDAHGHAIRATVDQTHVHVDLCGFCCTQNVYCIHCTALSGCRQY